MRRSDRSIARRLAVLLLSLAPGAASAHPHIFIDGGLDFLFDAHGRIESLRVTWIYDPLSSLFMLEDLYISPDEAETLDPADSARLAEYQTRWDQGFEGDSYLWNGLTRVALSGPVEPAARVRDGRIEITFLRELEAPFRPGRETDASGASGTVVKVYDPTFYTKYSVTSAPRLEGAARDCRATVAPFEPTGPLAALQETLTAIPIDGDPDGEPGALFADRVTVACD